MYPYKHSGRGLDVIGVLKKKERTFAIKTLLLILHVPFKVDPSTGDTPFPKLLPSQKVRSRNASWNALSVMARSYLIAFFLISSIVWKRRSFKVVLCLGNRKKPAGAKSGE
jgi:hypothetical protein